MSKNLMAVLIVLVIALPPLAIFWGKARDDRFMKPILAESVVSLKNARHELEIQQQLYSKGDELAERILPLTNMNVTAGSFHISSPCVIVYARRHEADKIELCSEIQVNPKIGKPHLKHQENLNLEKYIKNDERFSPDHPNVAMNKFYRLSRRCDAPKYTVFVETTNRVPPNQRLAALLNEFSIAKQAVIIGEERPGRKVGVYVAGGATGNPVAIETRLRIWIVSLESDSVLATKEFIGNPPDKIDFPVFGGTLGIGVVDGRNEALQQAAKWLSSNSDVTISLGAR